MEMARLAPQIEPELGILLDDWDRLTSTGRKTVKIEDLCKARNVDAMHFFSVVNEAAMKFRDNATLMIASMNAPGLLEKSVQYGMQKAWIQRSSGNSATCRNIPISSRNSN